MAEIDKEEWGKLQKTVENIEANTTKIKIVLEKQNGRVRKLENWRSYLTGAISVIGVMLAVILKVVL